jgi:hypothetical protein
MDLKAILRLVAWNNDPRLFTYVGDSSPDTVLRSFVSYRLTPVIDFVECLFCIFICNHDLFY